jgi:lipoprotein-releasing system permease protein
MSYTGTAQKYWDNLKNYIAESVYKWHRRFAEFHKAFNFYGLSNGKSQFETGSTVRSIISYSVGIVLIVAGFGIYNILNMMI